MAEPVDAAVPAEEAIVHSARKDGGLAVGPGALCANCGASLSGRFCAVCGQEDRPLDPGVGEVAREVVREISALDGRILRSVRRLFLSPGFLTREYLQGRRVTWVSPVRLYLTFSVVYFALAALLGESPLNINVGFTGGETQRLGFSSDEELQRAINQALTTWIPRAMFLLVPVFAWLVSLVRRRSRRKYPQHLIFALHVFAALFGSQAIAVAAGYVADSPALASSVGIAALLYMWIYLVSALRAVYGGTLGRALIHTVVILIGYWMATILVAAAILVPVLFWR